MSCMHLSRLKRFNLRTDPLDRVRFSARPCLEDGKTRSLEKPLPPGFSYQYFVNWREKKKSSRCRFSTPSEEYLHMNTSICSRKEQERMSASQEQQPTLDSVAPRFLVGDMEQALAFYGQLGFAAPYHDEGFAILERDQITLQFNVSDPTHELSREGCRVCYITVTNIEALYQQYLSMGAVRSPIQATDWGTKGFWLSDPFRNILIFEENIPEEEIATQSGV